MTRRNAKPLIFLLLAGLLTAWLPAPVIAVTRAASDAYVTFDGASNTWALGTSKVEKKLQLTTRGQYLLKSFRNKASGREYIQGSAVSDEFAVRFGSTTYTGATAGWVSDGYTTATLPQGELEVIITLHNAMVKVSRHYVLYPSTGVVQEWSDFHNVSGVQQPVSDPAIFRHRIMGTDLPSTEFGYMTGGGNFSGSNVFKLLPYAARPGQGNYHRLFDSHDQPEVMRVDGTTGEVNSNVQGTAVYNEFFVLRNSVTAEGVFLTFDYAGHWAADVGNAASSPGSFLMAGKVHMNGKPVAPGGQLSSPKAMLGVFTGDIDDMGNTILDYVYRYKWDQTREEYFGKVRVSQWLGMWAQPNVAQTPNAFAAINAARYVGADGMWIDDEWFDVRGNWNPIYGDDMKAINDYARKNGMVFNAWYPTWHAGGRPDLHMDAPSTVLAEHPEFRVANDQTGYYGRHLDNAKPEVIAWQRELLNRRQLEWGPHMWRYDGEAVFPSGSNENEMLAQSANWYKMLGQFKQDNPAAGIFGCSSGGELLTVEAARSADIQQTTDGYQQHYDGYWTTLLTPPDKLAAQSNLPTNSDLSLPYKKAVRGTLRSPFLLNAATAQTNAGTQADKEARRKDVELYHYLRTQGVAGRWTKVYRPRTSANVDPTYFQQKLSQDGLRGYITIYANVSTPGSAPVSAIGQNVTVYPKGLQPAANYTIATLEGGLPTKTRTGAEWMQDGVTLTPLRDGEVIFLNLENRPGTGTDNTAPTTPSSVTKQLARHLTRSGVELTWKAGTDNNWISYYEILRNGVAIDKVAKGTFYFDVRGNASDTYEVRTVDGDNNPSAPQLAVRADLDTSALDTGFAEVQGRNSWSYFTKNGSTTTPMTWSATAGQWRGPGPYNFVGDPANIHPDAADTGIAWTAPKAGTARIEGLVRKVTAGGDGVNARILKNGSQIWPTEGSQYIAGVDTVGFRHDFTATVVAGDRISFEVSKGNHGDIDFDETSWSPKITYGGNPNPTPATVPTYDLAADYSSRQGQKNWFNRQWDGSTYTDLSWEPLDYRWKGTQAYNNIHAPNLMHPDASDTVKAWAAPKPGAVNIKGSVAKADSGGGDGIRARILRNGQQIWPAAGWQSIAATDRIGAVIDVTIQVAQGDVLSFVVNRGSAGNHSYDLTNWKSTIRYTGTTDPDLVGAWPFNEASGSGTSDTSGNGNTGVLLNGVARDAGRSGPGLDFDGVDSHLRVEPSPSLTNLQEGDYTVAAWFKPTNTPPGTGAANNAAYAVVAKPGYHLGLYYAGNGRYTMFHYLTGDAPVAAESALTFPADGTTWHHLTGVVNRTAGTVKLYVDGVLRGSATFAAGTGSREYGTLPWFVGIANPGAADYRWAADGAIDEVRMYRKALSAEDVRVLAMNS